MAWDSADQLWTGVASRREELTQLLAEYAALSPSRPGVLELRLGAEEMPPFSPFLDADAETEVAVPPLGRVARSAA